MILFVAARVGEYRQSHKTTNIIFNTHTRTDVFSQHLTCVLYFHVPYIRFLIAVTYLHYRFQRPVGLKNVGQTCWFSAVIQSLFYLPAFRHLVLNYTPPSAPPQVNGMTPSLVDPRRKRICEFMLELRKLFALMVASQRKYVDPSKAVELLRGSVGGGGGGNGSSVIATDNIQQDVSEFTHLVLEWVEDAFKKAEPASSDVMKAPAAAAAASSSTKEEDLMDDAENVDPNKQQLDSAEREKSVTTEVPEPATAAESPDDREASLAENPISELFYGRMQVEGKRQGCDFERSEQFGQYPLQVNNFFDLHESLENSTAHEKIIPSAGDSEEGDDWQEQWLTKVPPLLMFSLSRFQFNQERRHAEKIHNRFEFPEKLFMDRYVAGNKVATRVKREEVRRLKVNKEDLQAKLNKYTEFAGSSTADSCEEPPAKKMPMPIQLVLQYAMDFASTPQPSSDVNMASPLDGSNLLQQNQQQPSLMKTAASNLMQVDSPCGSPKMTPASSVTNLATGTSEPMEMDEPVVDVAPVIVEANKSSSSVSCDNNISDAAVAPSPGSKDGRVPTANAPCPRHVSDVELQVIKVSRKCSNLTNVMHNCIMSYEYDES